MKPTFVDQEWAGGTHRFDLKIAQIRELEETAGEGVFRIIGSFHGYRKTYRYGYDTQGQQIIVESLVPEITARSFTIRETIRLGLIGGGMSPEAARKLVVKYVDGTPISEHVNAAMVILAAFAYGAPEDDSVVEEDDQDPAQPAMGGSTSPASTGPLQ
jgi:hypothetical protein